MSSHNDVNARLLLVEDEHMLRRMLHRQLELNGFTVISAYDGRDALAAVAGREVDVFVVDLNLPDSSGTDVAKLLLERCPDAKLLYISGQPVDFNLDPAGPALAKPFTVPELVATIRKLLGPAEIRG